MQQSGFGFCQALVGICLRGSFMQNTNDATVQAASTIALITNNTPGGEASDAWKN
jgi:hypothetical protein